MVFMLILMLFLMMLNSECLFCLWLVVLGSLCLVV